MAFLKTSDSIIIKAALTDEGRKLLAQGNLKISKFAFGDDEIDYSLIDPKKISKGESYVPAVDKIKLFEAYGDEHKNIQFGLNSFDSGILYLTAGQKEEISPSLHAYLMYIPFLKQNNKLSITPTISGSMAYLSVNDETTEKLNSISNFNFLTTNKFDTCKLIVESGLSNLDVAAFGGAVPLGYTKASKASREDLILKKFLLDNDYFVFVDDRFLRQISGTNLKSKFENYASGETVIKFLSSAPAAPISLQSEFNNYATYAFRGIPNLMFDLFGGVTEITPGPGTVHSVHEGPRGSILAINPLVAQELKTNSTSDRDFRFVEYGRTDQTVFSELPNSKFDYIDTTIYIIGATTNSRVHIPMRIVRYSGT